MASEVRSVVFDIGGVLLQWDPRLLYASLIPDTAELDWFLHEVCTMAWNGELDAGRSFDEACDELAARHPDHAELVHAWRRQDEMIVGEIPGTAALVERLRAAGVPLHLLTNMPADVFRDRLERYEVLRRFDGAVVSGDEAVVKPDPEIFRRLAERFDLEPAATLFVDDAEVNVLGARAAGFQAHHFVDATTLERELLELGLLPAFPAAVSSGRPSPAATPARTRSAAGQPPQREPLVMTAQDDGDTDWDDEAATFDLEPDHGLLDPAVRLAWEQLLVPFLPAPPAAAIDLGCGTGSLSLLLAGHGLEVTGVDRSPKMLERAAAKAASGGLKIDLVLGDAAEPPVSPSSVDLVLCRHVLWALPAPGDAIRRWRALLRPGGRLLAIEGSWSTGAGIAADVARTLVSAHFPRVELLVLDDPALWGRPIEDERYLLVGECG